MKKIAAFFALLFLLCLSTFALSEAAFRKGTEILYAEACPDEYVYIENKLSVGMGETLAIKANALKFASSDESVLGVNANGEVTLFKTGTAILRTYFSADSYHDITVTVKKAPASISLSHENGFMDVGGHYQLSYTLSKDSAGTVTWHTSNPEIITVNETGYLSAVGAGECMITAQTYNGLSAACHVKVSAPPPAEVKLSAYQGVMYVGETYKLGCTLEGGYKETVSWSSSDESVLTVSRDGLLTAHAEGEAVITAEASGGNSAQCAVTVRPGSVSIKVAPNPIFLYENGRMELKPQIEGGSGKYALYSMDESLLVIDEETGELHARRLGEAYIVFVTPNLLFAECTVNILPAPESLLLISPETVLAEGESTALSLNLNGFESLPVTYKTSPSGILSVSDNGIVSGKKPGKAEIIAYTGGLQAQTEIEVVPIATAIRLTADKTLLGVGDTTLLHTELSGGSGRVSIVSDRSDIVCVDEKTGVLTALSSGECTVTASLVNGVSSSVTVRTVPAPETFSLATEAVVLGTGDAHAFMYTLSEGAAATVTFTCSDPSLLRIEENTLYALDTIGQATIHAETHNGLTSQMHVTVREAPSSIDVNAAPLTSHASFDSYLHLKTGSVHSLSPACDGYSGQLFKIVSSHPDIAAVDASGNLTAVKHGTALITISLLSGAETNVLVIVE